MRPRERRDSGQNDLFKARLDQIVDMNRPLIKLARAIDWETLTEQRAAALARRRRGRPPDNVEDGIALPAHL